MKWVKRGAVTIVAAAVLSGGYGYVTLRGSLPDVEGEHVLTGLSDVVRVERDALGVPTLRASSRIDLARALGFVHAQERYFQMDLLRRRAAGELAEIVGEAALPLDRRHRLHRMRARAERLVRDSTPEERAPLEAYASGVRAGLGALSAPPFEYRLRGIEPVPWRVEDSFLVVAAMYFDLNDAWGSYESTVGLLHDVLPGPLAELLTPVGTEWDAPVAGASFRTPAVPGPEVFRLRAQPAKAAALVGPLFDETLGSNNWAVAGGRSTHGGALLANDMHLGHGVPNIWFRARMLWGERELVGVTLPGTPYLVAGSNSQIAWGFTNSNGDWIDLVELEIDPNDENRYLTPDGYRAFETHQEILRVSGGEDEAFEVRETIWGPVVDEDHEARPRAVRWIAHDPEGINLEMGHLETATSVDEALARAKRAGIPPQNFVCADASGRIGWTLAGKIPRRFGHDGRRPSSWASGERGWDGFLDEDSYPEIVDPPEGIIWTANARVIGGDGLETIGDGGYAFGARARQIRDGLVLRRQASEKDMLELQLDDRALFLGFWRDYFLRVTKDDELRRLLETTWTGRASVDSAAYRLTRELRVAIFETVFSALTAKAAEADPRFSVHRLRQWDGPLWRLVNEKPEHLVPPEHDGWDDWMNAIVSRALAEWRREGPLSARTWGEARRVQVRHPFSAGAPWLGRFTDLPARPLPGDSHLPRAQGVSSGASERLVVSPGRESQGLFHMPGGQSGHPLSPYYGAGHEDWATGAPTPLLPGPTVYRLTLEPGERD